MVGQPVAAVQRTTLVIPELPIGMNSSGSGRHRRKGLLGMHWTARQEYFGSWYWKIAAAVAESGWPRFTGAVRITITRYSVEAMDWDNYGSSLKPVMDGLIKSQVIQDDNPSIVTKLELAQAQCRSSDRRIQIDIEEVSK